MLLTSSKKKKKKKNMLAACVVCVYIYIYGVIDREGIFDEETESGGGLKADACVVRHVMSCHVMSKAF